MQGGVQPQANAKTSTQTRRIGRVQRCKRRGPTEESERVPIAERTDGGCGRVRNGELSFSEHRDVAEALVRHDAELQACGRRAQGQRHSWRGERETERTSAVARPQRDVFSERSATEQRVKKVSDVQRPAYRSPFARRALRRCSRVPRARPASPEARSTTRRETRNDGKRRRMTKNKTKMTARHTRRPIALIWMSGDASSRSTTTPARGPTTIHRCEV